jgi:Zn-dependent protease
MLNETASSRDHRPAARTFTPPAEVGGDSPNDRVREMVGTVLTIERETSGDNSMTPRDLILLNPEGHLIASYEGRLLLDSEAAYDQLDKLLEPVNMLPVFRLRNGKPVVYILAGRVHPQPRPWWPNAALAALTFLSVWFVGGMDYAIAIMVILGAHELGHYFAARRHNVAVTLPYFIPFPLGLGTLGAAIQLRQPMRNRKVLLDVGAAGPLVGLVVSIPILLFGLATSEVIDLNEARANLPEGHVLVMEGNSVLYAMAKIVTFGRFLPDGPVDVSINGIAKAGWLGLLVTGLNLIPIGQLDGGHILYSIIGERARALFYPILIAMVALALFASDMWFVWAVLILFLGQIYATPLDNVTRLDRPRQMIAVLGLVLFVMAFVPIPQSPLLDEGNIAQAAPNLLSILTGH